MKLGSAARLLAALTGVVILVGCGASPAPRSTETGPPASPTASTPASAASAAPAPARPAPGDHRVTVDVGGVSREVLVHAPTGYQPGRTYPAVVALHGSVTDVTAMPRISGLSQLADANGFLVFYLQGIDNSWNGYTCCGGSQDDVGFAKAVVEHAVKTWNADANRVYAVGHWAGGSLAYELVAELPGTFAALGVVNGAYTSAARGGRAWTAPVPVVLFLGEQGRAAPTFQTRLLDHVKDLGCPELQPAFLGANKRITRATVTCRGGIDLDVYWFRDVATEWPGPGTGATEADRRSMAVDQGFDAGEVMWAFFAKRSRKA